MSTRNYVKNYVLSQTSPLTVQQVQRGLHYRGVSLSDSQVWRHLSNLRRAGELRCDKIGGVNRYGKPLSVETTSFSPLPTDHPALATANA
jgi:hypothetical protein